MIKKFITWLTRPKITVVLRSGATVRCKDLETYSNILNASLDSSIKNRLSAEFADAVRIEMISIRKWHQPWTKVL